ncbi:putative type I restriction-modification system S protein [Streptococcus pneumoniae]|nr:putative type I restriction-modification system S protein [Streptococcus pneumoniae]
MVKLTTCYFCDYGSYYGNKDETTSYPIYEIPEAWRYIKFASLVNFRIGKTPPRSEATFWGTEIPWVSISDMPISGYVTNTRESISKLALKSKKIDISPKGTLLMSFKLSIGKVAILDIPATHNEAIISIFPYAKENIIRDYLMIFLPLISTLGDSKDAIKGKTLNSTSISELLIPISNHEEMKRIISKVDLFLNKFNEPITARGVAQQLKNYADKYKMNPKVIYPHSFRHLFAKNFLAKYNDIALLADLMGHESIETTRIYLRKTATEQQNIVDKIVNW